MSHALYDRIGVGYLERRRPDERIAARISVALGQSRRVLNVGAGTGSYEPMDRLVIAVEPSVAMIRQRTPSAAQAVRASAGRLPFRDSSFDAALGVLTVHHWPNPSEGLDEMMRVARERVVVLTWDPQHSGFWLVREYFPEIAEIDRAIFPRLDELERALGPVDIQVVPIPSDCTDGFLGCYWRRPAEYLDASARAAMSTFSKFDHRAGLARLRRDLEDGTWLKRNGALLALGELDIGYRLIVARAPKRFARPIGCGVTITQGE